MNIKYIDFMVSDFRIESDSKLKNRQLKSRKERQSRPSPRVRPPVRPSTRVGEIAPTVGIRQPCITQDHQWNATE